MPFVAITSWLSSGKRSGSTTSRLGDHAKRIAALVPLAADKAIIDDVTTAYVCENRVCKKPTSDPEDFSRQLAPITPYP